MTRAVVLRANRPLQDACCEEGRARDERHSREEHRCFQPYQPIVSHGAPQLLDCVG